MSASNRDSSLPSLERLRKEAKKLLRLCREKDAAALARVRAQGEPKLADVQHALARERGFATWAALKREAEAREPLAAKAERFLAAVRDHLPERARELVGAHPAIACTGVHAACAAADAKAVADLLAEDPARATSPHDPDGWPPLHYACASPLGDQAASRRVVELLLERGADPGVTTGDEYPLSALYRSLEAGHLPSARLLLERGATTQDGESVYHMAEHDHQEALELLLEFGADLSSRQQPYGNTPLYFLSGYRDSHPASVAATRGMRWLLEHGADPNVTSYATEETPLHRVVDFGRGPAVIEILLEHGADATFPRADGRTPYVLAVRAGNRAALAILRARGAVAGSLTPVDEFLGACRLGDIEGARALLAKEPDLMRRLTDEDRGALARAAEDGQVAAVRALLDIGFDPGWEGAWGGTPLHMAAWRGNGSWSGS